MKRLAHVSRRQRTALLLLLLLCVLQSSRGVGASARVMQLL
jgi:hypothetical protein